MHRCRYPCCKEVSYEAQAAPQMPSSALGPAPPSSALALSTLLGPSGLSCPDPCTPGCLSPFMPTDELMLALLHAPVLCPLQNFCLRQMSPSYSSSILPDLLCQYPQWMNPFSSCTVLLCQWHQQPLLCQTCLWPWSGPLSQTSLLACPILQPGLSALSLPVSRPMVLLPVCAADA